MANLYLCNSGEQGNNGAEYLRYDASTKYVQALQIDGTWKNIYAASNGLPLPVIYKGYTLYSQGSGEGCFATSKIGTFRNNTFTDQGYVNAWGRVLNNAKTNSINGTPRVLDTIWRPTADYCWEIVADGTNGYDISTNCGQTWAHIAKGGVYSYSGWSGLTVWVRTYIKVD